MVKEEQKIEKPRKHSNPSSIYNDNESIRSIANTSNRAQKQAPIQIVTPKDLPKASKFLNAKLRGNKIPKKL